MKQKILIILLLVLVFVTAVAAWFYGYYNRKSNDNLPTLTAIAEMDEADVNTLLMGYKRIQLVEVWGEPDSIKENEDIWVISDTVSLRVNSNNKGKVVICGLIESTEFSDDESEQWDLIPMVMVNGDLYLDTGYPGESVRKFGTMDGEITSTVDGSERPSEDDQSNFGTGYGYQYGSTEGTIEIYMNGKWWIYATEDVKQQLQFPEQALEESVWGVTLKADNVTPTGLTIVCNQTGGYPTGELHTGSWYCLEKYTAKGWKEIKILPQKYDVVWTAEAWIIPMENSVKWDVNWEWLYGKLRAGKYRIGKEVTDFRDTGDYDTKIHYAEFEIIE